MNRADNMNKLPIKWILLVDDESDIIELFKSILKSYDAKVVVAQDGEDGLNKAINQKFDLILTDHKMPKKTGLDFIKRIREKSLNKETPVIVISGHLDKDLIMEFAKNRNSHILVKPLDSIKFEELLQKYLTRKKLH
jgi:two-component system, chemotaxis family, chemotaxis protein CheY